MANHTLLRRSTPLFAAAVLVGAACTPQTESVDVHPTNGDTAGTGGDPHASGDPVGPGGDLAGPGSDPAGTTGDPAVASDHDPSGGDDDGGDDAGDPGAAGDPATPPVVSVPTLTTIDADATGYGTFQSHNQKVVWTAFGIFATYVKTPFVNATWRLVRSTDDGASFQTVHEGINTTHPPAIDAAADGTIYLVHGDETTGQATFYRFSPLTSFAPEVLAVVSSAHAQKFNLLLDEARGVLYYLGYLGPDTRFVKLDVTGAVLTNIMLTGSDALSKPTYPRLILQDGILYVAWSTDMVGGDNNDYYSIHALRSPDGGLSWQNLAGASLVPPFSGGAGGNTTEITHDWERPCISWLAGFAVTRGKAHFFYRLAPNASQPTCTATSTMRYQRFDVASGAREADLSDFAPAGVPFDSLDGFFATSARDHTLFMTSRTSDNRLATVASTDDATTWQLVSESAPLTDVLYALGGQRAVTAGGQVIGTYTHQATPCAVRFFKADVVPVPSEPAGTRLAATLTASTEAGGYPITNADDDDVDTAWVASLTPSTANNDAWVELDLGSVQYVADSRFLAAYAPYPANGPSEYAVTASIDGVTWRPVAGVAVPSGYASAAGAVRHEVDGAARWLRLTTTRVNDGTGWALGLAELWAEGAPYPAPGSAHLPATMTASAAAAGYPTSQATDGNAGSQWLASLTSTTANNNAWVALDLGEVRHVTRLRWLGATGSPYPAHSPSDYVVDSSIDGVNWVTAVSRTHAAGVTSGDELMGRNARFLRLTTTKVHDGTGWALSLYELWAE